MKQEWFHLYLHTTGDSVAEDDSRNLLSNQFGSSLIVAEEKPICLNNHEKISMRRDWSHFYQHSADDSLKHHDVRPETKAQKRSERLKDFLHKQPSRISFAHPQEQQPILDTNERLQAVTDNQFNSNLLETKKSNESVSPRVSVRIPDVEEEKTSEEEKHDSGDDMLDNSLRRRFAHNGLKILKMTDEQLDSSARSHQSDNPKMTRGSISRKERRSCQFVSMSSLAAAIAAADNPESVDFLTTKMTLYDEAIHYLGMSFFVYRYSFQRDQSKRGLTKFPFETFAIESDTMTDFEIIQQVPLKLKPRSSHSDKDIDELIAELGGITMSQLYIREMQALAEYGFPRKVKDLLATIKKKGLAAVRLSSWVAESMKNHSEDEKNRKLDPKGSTLKKFLKRCSKKAGAGDKEEDDILDEPPPLVIPCKTSKTIDGMAQHGLKFCDPDRSKHVGRLGSELGMHHVQCSFDQIFHKATKEKDPLYMKAKELYQRPNNGKLDSQDITVEDQIVVALVMEHLHKESSILRLLTRPSLGSHEILVWIYDRSKEECVYLIFLNPVLKRITVIFRGTVTLEDILKNCKFKVFHMKNPIHEDYEGKTTNLEVNNGYSEYLFQKRLDNGRTKYDEISDRVLEFAEYLWGKDPKFELCVSGHSLGGALATLFAFKASTDPRFVQSRNPKPIRTFTYGGAIPGRITFAKAFQHQEEVGKLVHLRAVMKNDIVPRLHPMNQYDFAHTGYTIKLETKRYGRGQKKNGCKKSNQKSTPPKYKYVHDKSWWNTKSANLQTNFLNHFPWRNPKFVIVSHAPKMYLKALIEARGDRQSGILSVETAEGFVDNDTLPENPYYWTLDEHYLQMNIRKSKKALRSTMARVKQNRKRISTLVYEE